MISPIARPFPAVLRVTLTACALLLALAAVAHAKPRAPRSKASSAAPAPAASAAKPTAASPAEPMLALYVDPDAQEIDLVPGPGRVPLQLGLAQLKALDASSEGLTQVTKDGVTLIDFRGQFQPVWVAVTGKDGHVRPFCLTSLPANVRAAAQQLRREAGHDR